MGGPASRTACEDLEAWNPYVQPGIHNNNDTTTNTNDGNHNDNTTNNNNDNINDLNKMFNI